MARPWAMRISPVVIADNPSTPSKKYGRRKMLPKSTAVVTQIRKIAIEKGLLRDRGTYITRCLTSRSTITNAGSERTTGVQETINVVFAPAACVAPVDAVAQ